MARTVFEYRDSIIGEYSKFSRSFTEIAAEDIKRLVDVPNTTMDAFGQTP